MTQVVNKPTFMAAKMLKHVALPFQCPCNHPDMTPCYMGPLGIRRGCTYDGAPEYEEWLVATYGEEQVTILKLREEVQDLKRQLEECQSNAEQLADTNAELRESLESAISGPGGWDVPLDDES